MPITQTLPNFPQVNQLNEKTSDGQADENARLNCVAASVAASLTYLLGRSFNGDELHDAVYGQGYLGVQSAAHYAAYCANLGVHLAPFSGAQNALVAELHAQVSAGHPCLVTMPSEWGTTPADPVHPSGSTHVSVACGQGSGMLRILNVWGGFMQDATDEWWAARLCDGQVWPMRLTNEKGLPTMWTSPNAGVARDARGVLAHNAMATYLLAHNTLGDVVAGFPGEQYYAAGRSFLPLEGDTVLQWDASRGTVVEAGGEVASALYYVLQDMRTAADASAHALSAAQQAAQQAVADAAAQAKTLQQKIDTLTQALSAAQTQQAQQTPATPPTPPAPPAPPVIAPQEALDALVRSIYAQALVEYDRSRRPA